MSYIIENTKLEHKQSFPVATPEVYNITNTIDVSYVNPLCLSVNLGNTEVTMEVDTGAGVSCLPYSFYVTNLVKYKLETTKLKLKSYGGQVINPVGVINVPMEYNGVSKMVDILVVKESDKKLLGRNILDNFGFKVTVGNANENEVSVSEKGLEFE